MLNVLITSFPFLHNHYQKPDIHHISTWKGVGYEFGQVRSLTLARLSNPKIASLAARLVESHRPNRQRRSDDDEDDDDDEVLFAELEAEIENDSNAALREQGLDVLRREMEKMQQMKQSQHGQYTEISDEKEVVRVSA
ncbi:hypothetical protein H0H81_006777 [Sphagnurus paluster]|uniref:Uncharacterized protein n=1 Tax=Sphagnurus paluster TaxID=117069 RepID=A0A9P7GJU7_9AGAR|nr:hypothetical protein H0H81_006777 [Sphagnurus paluster]